MGKVEATARKVAAIADWCVAAGARGDVEVRGVQYDSRRVSGGDVFVAMCGGATDGNRFIEQALQKGAAAVVTDSREAYDALCEKQPELAVALVEHGRRALAEVSAEVFGHPERVLKLSAVTGTNGKTTTAFLLEQMLQSVWDASVFCWERLRRMSRELCARVRIRLPRAGMCLRCLQRV